MVSVAYSCLFYRSWHKSRRYGEQNGGSMQRDFFCLRSLVAGLLLLVLGTAPFVLDIVFLKGRTEPSPHSAGLDLLAWFVFWPSVVLMVGGLIQCLIRLKKSARRTLIRRQPSALRCPARRPSRVHAASSARPGASTKQRHPCKRS